MNCESVEKFYAPPVSQLLSLGEPRRNKWRDYAAMGISMDAVPDLIRMATDEQLNNGPQKSPLVWAPVHAWRALGQLRTPEAVAPLLALLQRIDDAQDDWVAEDLPEALARIGAPVIEPVANYLADTVRGEWSRVSAADTLGHIGQTHPDLRAECVARLATQLEKFAEQSDTLNAFLVSPLWDLRAVEAVQVIERAFTSGRVDESVMGDFEDVQIHFGLKRQREHPPKPNSLTEMHDKLVGLRGKIHAIEQENTELRGVLGLAQAEAELDDALDDFPPDPSSEPYVAPPKTGRNEPCPCGSGKKYKKCCGA